MGQPSFSDALCLEKTWICLTTSGTFEDEKSHICTLDVTSSEPLDCN